MPRDITDKLETTRMLAIDMIKHHERMHIALANAMRGMSRRRATDQSGTGHCPLTDWGPKYTEEKELYEELKARAVGINMELEPFVKALPDKTARKIVEMYYLSGLPMDDIAAHIGITLKQASRLRVVAVKAMEAM